ncbi:MULTISPECIES: hypothetical protein [unclassified Streptomyces]|uniref:hypothetical protein n=1 Tax=unclassified Streptomyces TaxID=2593676 RepID=UPI00045352DA|nr:hypothetical protein [Streptomyces sp. PCS3-D2]WKV70524.1 hypothetical protein AW27_002730 [Streptomyces sp. PCS3-D2]
MRFRTCRAALYRWVTAERRLGLVLAAAGLPVTCLGAVMYVLPGPGFPFVVIGLSLFLTGVVMALGGQDVER